MIRRNENDVFTDSLLSLDSEPCWMSNCSRWNFLDHQTILICSMDIVYRRERRQGMRTCTDGHHHHHHRSTTREKTNSKQAEHTLTFEHVDNRHWEMDRAVCFHVDQLHHSLVHVCTQARHIQRCTRSYQEKFIILILWLTLKRSEQQRLVTNPSAFVYITISRHFIEEESCLKFNSAG
jgi:hypothetical protein